MTKQVTFVDGLNNVAVTGPIVRLEFLHLVGVKDNQPQFVPGEQMVMPLEGFLRAFDMQRRVIAQMVKDGVIKLNEEGAVAPAQETSNAAAAPEATSPVSPNFIN
jgi:hypothetical protein